MQRAAAVRQTDRELLTRVLEEITDRVTRSQRESMAGEAEAKVARLVAEKTILEKELAVINREVAMLIPRERELDQQIINNDKEYVVKWKTIDRL